ncbi:MAG: ABC transporter permease [Chloroflexota bacterium]|nr:ABC transporter permease [Chloroflexota bacterium]
MAQAVSASAPPGVLRPGIRSPQMQLARRIARNLPAVLGAAVIVAMVGVALFAPVIARYPYDQTNLSAVEQAPSLAHWFGTDALGRDMFSRVVWGARSAIFVILMVTLVDLALGLPLGAAAGYFRDTSFSLSIFLVEVGGAVGAALGMIVYLANSDFSNWTPLLTSILVILAVVLGVLVNHFAMRLSWWRVAIFVLLLTNLGLYLVGIGGSSIGTPIAVAGGTLLFMLFWILLLELYSFARRLEGVSGAILKVLFLTTGIDTLVMRVADILFAFPSLLFVFFIAATIKPGILTWARSIGLADLARTGYLDYAVVIIALGLVGWAGLARLIRAQVLSVKEREFVLSAHAVGVPTWKVIARHILPNSLAPVIVALSMGMGDIALSEGYLSFLGVGLQPPAPSWGNILADNAGRYWRTFPQMIWLVLIPGLVLAAIVFAFIFLGDELNEALIPEISA